MDTNRKQGPVASDKSDIVARLPSACRDERAAVEFLEDQRWGREPFCPHCGTVGDCYAMRNRATGERNTRFLWRCRSCSKQFTVRVGTVFEDSRIPLMQWCLGFWLACSSKKGVSALQIKRLTGLSYKSALFMMHRIRFAMSDAPGDVEQLKGTVEVDETYVGGKPRRPQLGPRGRNRSGKGGMVKDNKARVVGMIERGGTLRPMAVEDDIKAHMVKHIRRDALIVTDESYLYRNADRLFAGHETVRHTAREYVRGKIHTNTIEGFFSLLKRGIYGTFHSVSRKHLHRYLSEFQYRFNTRTIDDGARTALAMRKAFGKRLTYREQTRPA